MFAGGSAMGWWQNPDAESMPTIILSDGLQDIGTNSHNAVERVAALRKARGFVWCVQDWLCSAQAIHGWVSRICESHLHGMNPGAVRREHPGGDIRPGCLCKCTQHQNPRCPHCVE